MNIEIPVFIQNKPVSEPKNPYTADEDKFIQDNFPTKTHKYMAGKLHRSIDSIRSRCRILKLIRPAVSKRMVVAAVRTGQSQPEGLDLSELPIHLQRWFGLVPNVEIPLASKDKPYIRKIDERMPDFTVSKTKHSIGCGTQYQIGELASL